MYNRHRRTDIFWLSVTVLSRLGIKNVVKRTELYKYLYFRSKTFLLTQEILPFKIFAYLILLLISELSSLTLSKPRLWLKQKSQFTNTNFGQWL